MSILTEPRQGRSVLTSCSMGHSSRTRQESFGRLDRRGGRSAEWGKPASHRSSPYPVSGDCEHVASDTVRHLGSSCSSSFTAADGGCRGGARCGRRHRISHTCPDDSGSIPSGVIRIPGAEEREAHDRRGEVQLHQCDQGLKKKPSPGSRASPPTTPSCSGIATPSAADYGSPHGIGLLPLAPDVPPPLRSNNCNPSIPPSTSPTGIGP